jgi:hypothetical protein
MRLEQFYEQIYEHLNKWEGKTHGLKIYVAIKKQT